MLFVFPCGWWIIGEIKGIPTTHTHMQNVSLLEPQLWKLDHKSPLPGLFCETPVSPLPKPLVTPFPLRLPRCKGRASKEQTPRWTNRARL